MSSDVVVVAKLRTDVGKRAVAKLRADGLVPAVIQEHGKQSRPVAINGQEMLKAYQAVGHSQAFELSIDGQKQLALIKELELVPLLPLVQHVVFQALKAGEAVDAQIPIQLTGDIPAESNSGLSLLKVIDELEVRALPKDLPEFLDIAATNLAAVDDKLTIADLQLPNGVELVELLAIGDDEERRTEFLSQPIVLVKDATVVEVDEGTELAEGESEADVVKADNGAQPEAETA